MNYGSAGGLHDTATYLTLKMDIVLLLKGQLDLEEPIVKTDNSDIVFWKRIFPKSPYNWEKEGKPMRDFNYHKLAERTWDNEILSYLAQIHEHKSNNWMMHLQGI